MNGKAILKSVGAFLENNSTTILTGASVAGVFGTAIFAIRATPRAKELYEDLRDKYEGEKIPTKELIKTVGPVFLPTAGMIVLTSGCIIASNRISSKQRALIASLYSASEVAMKEYQNKVLEAFGETKEHKIRDLIAKDRLERQPVADSQIIITGKGKSLCYDTWSGRYFESDIEKLRQIENDINHEIIASMWVDVNELYYQLELPPILSGEEVGWNVDNRLEFVFSSQIADDGRPCLVISYRNRPRKYNY